MVDSLKGPGSAASVRLDLNQAKGDARSAVTLLTNAAFNVDHWQSLIAASASKDK